MNAVRVARKPKRDVVVHEEQRAVIVAQLSQPRGDREHVTSVSRLVPELQHTRPAAQRRLRDLHDGTPPRGIRPHDDVEAVNLGCDFDSLQ